MSQLRRRSTRRRTTYEENDSTRRIDGQDYYRINGDTRVIGGKQRQIYRDATGNDYFMDDDGQVRGIATPLRLPPKTGKRNWRKLRQHVRARARWKKVRLKFNRVLARIKKDKELQRTLRQLSDGPDVNMAELRKASPEIATIVRQGSEELPAASDEAKETQVAAQNDSGHIEFFASAAEAVHLGFTVLGTVTGQAFDTLENAADAAVTAADAAVVTTVGVSGVVVVKTAEGTWFVAKRTGKLMLGIVDYTWQRAPDRQQVKGALRLTGSVLRGGAQTAGTVLRTGARTGGQVVGGVLRLTGSVLRGGAQLFGYLVGGGGGDPGDRDSSDEDSSSSDEESSDEESADDGRFASRGGGGDPPRSLRRQLRKLDNPGGGRLYTQARGGGRRGGAQQQTSERRNKKQANARDARAAARDARRTRKLFRPAFKQFVCS